MTPDLDKPTAREGARDLGVLRVASFRRLWAANLAGSVGQQFGTLALSVTAVTTLHASTFEMSVIAALGSMAYLVLGIPSGVWVDRWSKRRVLLTAEVVRAVAIAGVPIAFVLGVLSVAQLMVVAAVTGVADLFFGVAHTSILPAIVSRARVSEASARLQTSDTTIRVVGPGLAGQILQFTGGPLVYGVTAITHALSWLFISGIDVAEPTSGNTTGNTSGNAARDTTRHAARNGARDREREPFWNSLRTGLGFVAGHPVLRTFLMSGALINLGAGAYSAVLALFVLRDLGLSPALFGLATSIGALGGIIGSLAGLRVKKALGSIRAVIVCYCSLSAAFAMVPLTAVLPVPHVVPITVSSLLFSALLVMASISSTGINARVTPYSLMGRVTSARRFVTMGAVPVGAMVGGLVATLTGNTWTLWLAALLAALTIVPFACSPLLTVRELPGTWEAET
ncbi:MFS transporter [Streptosporangium sp. NPDC006007]|uniref:MFS transporter n=1 Tax=Streptosporangium sp. NPDC006007 TaxID=3154575 RepID=UPI0033A19C00